MKKINTNNGESLFLEEYGETVNPMMGAIDFAYKNYIEPVELKEGMKILDIGFGLGYNSACAVSKVNRLRIVGLEKDRKIINKIQTIKVPEDFEDSYFIIREAAGNLSFRDGSYDINILTGDARKTILTLNEKFDIVFLDGFSTLKSPEIYTLDFLNEVKKRINESGTLITFNSSPIIRAALLQSGFKIKSFETGKNTKGTLASLNKDYDLDGEELRFVKAFGAILRDENLKNKREDIVVGLLI